MQTQERPRSETSEILTERQQGAAERVALGANPLGSMLRIVGFALAFVLIFGTLFFFLQR